MDPNNYMVCVSCMTYNHAPYIEDALNGFCMQQTTFPFVCTIIDDASTDGEQEVINNYLFKHFDIEDKSIVQNEETDDYTLTFARHKTNLNCFFAVLYLKYNHYKKKDKKPYVAKWRDNCKYIAFCEGDDYWTDPLKLQKQVDILEHNPSIKLVHTAFQVIDDKNTLLTMEPFISFMNKSKTGDVFKQLIRANYILTLTTCIRYEVLENNLYKKCPVSMDYLVFLTAAAMGDICYLSDITGCYRRTPTGAMMSDRERVVTTSMIIREYFHEAILRNEIPKYKFYEYTKLKYITATYAFNRYWYGKDKATFEKYQKTNGFFYLYFIIAFIQKGFEKLFRNR